MNKLDMVVIHDLKNNLMNVALRLESVEGTAKERASIMAASSKLTNLLLLNKYDNNEFDMQLDSDDPSELMEEMAANFMFMYPHLKIEVDATRSPEYWFYDRYYVELAVNSALHNAGEYTKSKVTLSAFEENGMLVFEVADDGTGYPDSVIEAFHADIPLSASRKGTGLGISLSHAIALKHENKGKLGAVTITNGQDGGARFALHLP